MTQDELDGMNEFFKKMFALTVHIVECDERNWPIQGWGSGLLWERGTILTLLTVAHNFKGKPRRLDARIPGNTGSLLIEIPDPGWMAVATLNPQKGSIEQAQDIDFAWVNYDLAALRTKLQRNPHEVVVPPLPAIRTPPTRIPDVNRPYGFAASIAKAYDHRTRELHTRNAFEAGMEFEGIQLAGTFAGCYRFKLARQHQGDAYYRGSSGAPVADDEGHPIALVAGGAATENVIFGTPLQPFLRYIDL